MWCWIRFAVAQLLWWRRRTLDANGSALTETKSPLSKCATSWASGTKTLTTAGETASLSAPTFPNAPTKERFHIIASILTPSIESKTAFAISVGSNMIRPSWKGITKRRVPKREQTTNATCNCFALAATNSKEIHPGQKPSPKPKN